MAKWLLTGFVTVGLATASGLYAFPERGRSAISAPAALEENTLQETGNPQPTKLETPGPEAARPAADTQPAKPTRTKPSRGTARERPAPVPHEVKEETPAVQATVAAAPEPEPPPSPVVQLESQVPVTSPVPSPVEALPPAPDSFGMLRALGGTGIVLTLMIGVFFALRRFAPSLIQKPSAQKTLKVVETLQMGEKRSIAIVQVGERRLLLGNTSTGITLITTLDGAAQRELAGVPAEVLTKPVQAPAVGFRNVYEIEKNPAAARGTGVPKTIAPNIRAKMRQLRESLEE